MIFECHTAIEVTSVSVKLDLGSQFIVSSTEYWKNKGHIEILISKDVGSAAYLNVVLLVVKDSIFNPS